MDAKVKIGDFFIQHGEEGKILRKVVSDDEFTLDYMYQVFESHGYYPVSLSTFELIEEYTEPII